MERIIWHSIRIGSADDQYPCEVYRDGKAWKAEVLEVWVETGRWWQGEKRCTCYRLLVEDGKVLEVCQEQGAGEWSLLRWID